MPIPIAALAAIPSLVKAGVGISQAIKGKKLSETKRPEYIPSKQNDFILEALLEDYNREEVSLNRSYERSELSANNAMEKILESGAGFSAITQVQANKDANDLNAIIGMEGLKAASMGRIIAHRQQMAINDDKSFMYNQFAPYADAVQEGRDMQGAGLENIMGGLTNLVDIGGYMKKVGGDGGIETGVLSGTSGVDNSTDDGKNRFNENFYKQVQALMEAKKNPLDGFGYNFD